MDRAVRAIKKVPEITLYFWVIKLLTTAMGEVGSDYLVHKIDPVIAVMLGGICLVIAFFLQFIASRYVAWIYWLAVSMVAVTGTMVADGIHIVLGIPYEVTTLSFVLILGCIFYIWYKTEKTLSIHSISTKRREVFYWLTVMATFALGTSAGDMTALTLHLGYFVSGILFGVLIAIPAILYWRFHSNEVALFWAAYIVTRPLGASFADWMGKPVTIGGLGFGSGFIGICLMLLIIFFIVYLTISQVDTEK